MLSVTMRDPLPPPIAPPMLLDTQVYTNRFERTDPEATTDSIDRRQLAAIVEELRSPNRIARDLILQTWGHARVRRTELILDRRGFRKTWRQRRDAAVAGVDVATAMLATTLVQAIDRMTPDALVACLCTMDGQTWEIFVDTDREELLGCRACRDIW